MAHDFRLYGGLLSGLPSLANREPGYVTDQPRLYVGNTSFGNGLLGCLNKINGTTAPTVNEDAGDGYSVGSQWVDTTNDKIYVCTDSTVGAAIWRETGGTSTGTGSHVFATSPTLVTPLLGVPTSGTLTNCTGLPLTTGVTGELPAANGGTGRASHTAYAVICGGTTSTAAQQSVASVGTSGHVLTSNGAGALPSFQAVSASSLDINGLTEVSPEDGDQFPIYDLSATANKKILIERFAATIPPVVTGRISTESGVGVSTSDRINQSTIYWVGSSRLPAKDATGWKWCAAPGSLTLSGLTASKQYDVMFDAVGSMDLMPAWTSDTARSSGLTFANGVWTNTSSYTRVIGGGTVSAGYAIYLGTIRANDATTIDDCEARRHLWNYFSRVRRPVRVFETTDTWNYSTATWRQLNNSTSNQVSIVCGIAGESCIDLWAHTRMSSSTIQVSYCGIGEDSATAPATENMTCPLPVSVNTGYACGAAHLAKFPAIGRRYYAHLERGAGSGTQTWYGDAGVDPLFRAGLVGDYDC